MSSPRHFLACALISAAGAGSCATAADGVPPRGGAAQDSSPTGSDGGPDPVTYDGGSTLDLDGASPDEPRLGDRVVRQGNVPGDVDRLFERAEPAIGQVPTLVYPTPNTMFPPSIARVLFQWTAPAGTIFHIAFDTAAGKLDVYTDGLHDTCEAAGTGAMCWESSATTLLPYLEALAGRDLKFQIRALEVGNPGRVWESNIDTVHVGPEKVSGAIYYWSTTAEGIRRGTLDGRDAADYLTPPLARDRCVACHTLSRSGKRMTIALPGDLLGMVDVVESIPPPVTYGPPPFEGGYIGASWATFSPDDSSLVVASQGILSLVDVRAATPVVVGTIALPDGIFGSMPDWSPDGARLVFTATPGQREARHLKGSSIAWLHVDGNRFSGYELIAESSARTCGDVKEAYANPMFSPDGRWLAFSRGDCESENDPSSEIIVAPAEPNAGQQPLTLANTAVGSQRLSGLQNGMPTWAPTKNSTVGWIAFTSTRDYGAVLTRGSQIGEKRRQLWVAAIDFSKMGTGDPSYPAFRLPAQDLTEDNHRPFWVLDVLPPDWVPVVR